MQCFTIGHSNRSQAEFLTILEEHEISEVVDIRSYPESRFEQFNRQNLEQALRARKIGYTHSPELGELQQLRGEAFKKGFAGLIKKIRLTEKSGERIVIMCAEKDPRECHRWQLSLMLEQTGVDVQHITEQGQRSLLNFRGD